MTERPTYVVDASVIGKWFLHGLPDEQYIQPALSLLSNFEAGRISLIGPAHLHYEVPSILCKAIGSRRISASKATDAVDAFQSLTIRMVYSPSLIRFGVSHAIHYQCTLYDALYLALAETAGLRFIHADSKLRRTLRGRFPSELWIENYQPAD